MAAQRLGITDFFPGLGAWVEENRTAIQAPGRARSQMQAETLLGAPARAEQVNTGPGGLTNVLPGFGGQGLMEDPNDFYNQMQYGLGLMGTQYHQDAGQTMLSQAGQAMLNKPHQDRQAQIAQSQYLADQALTQQQRDITNQQARENAARADKVAYANDSNALYKDAQALLKKPRQALGLFDNVQQTVRSKGFSGMNITDDTVLTKSLAKMLLPDEAVMEGDIRALQTMQGLPAIVRSLAGKVGAGIELLPEERQQLYDQLYQLGEQNVQQYQADRADFTARAEKRGIDPTMVLNTERTVDRKNQSGPRLKRLSPELNDQLDKQHADENPGILQGAWNAVTGVFE